jgi:hypothetical protein
MLQRQPPIVGAPDQVSGLVTFCAHTMLVMRVEQHKAIAAVDLRIGNHLVDVGLASRPVGATFTLRP